MNLCRKLRLAMLFASALGFTLLIPGATIRAQTVVTPAAQTDNQSSSDGGWHVAITPHIWFSGVHGATGDEVEPPHPSVRGAPSASPARMTSIVKHSK